MTLTHLLAHSSLCDRVMYALLTYSGMMIEEIEGIEGMKEELDPGTVHKVKRRQTTKTRNRGRGLPTWIV